MRRAAALLLAPALLLLAPGAARAQSGLELTATASQAEVPLGGTITITVRLRNTGGVPLELPRLAEDRQLVSFDVQLGDAANTPASQTRTFRYERITPSPYLPRTTWPVGELGADATWELACPLPAVAAGTLTVTAHYGRTPAAGLTTRPPHLTAPPLTVRITPAASGATEATVELVTTHGPIRLRLFPRDALGTCLHFARLVREGFHDGKVFHRIARNPAVIQGGCPLGTGTGDAGYAIPAELPVRDGQNQVAAGLRHVAGRLAMARSGHQDSAGSQFYICTGAAPHLDGDYTVFGEVVRGMDVVYTLGDVRAENERPLEEVKVVTARLRPDAPAPAPPGGGGQ